MQSCVTQVGLKVWDTAQLQSKLWCLCHSSCISFPALVVSVISQWVIDFWMCGNKIGQRSMFWGYLEEPSDWNLDGKLFGSSFVPDFFIPATGALPSVDKHRRQQACSEAHSETVPVPAGTALLFVILFQYSPCIFQRILVQQERGKHFLHFLKRTKCPGSACIKD